MNTVTRKQFQQAIEEGIRAVTPDGGSITPTEQAVLRAVGEAASRIGVGSYGDVGAPCPIACAFPDTWGDQNWNLCFARAYDRSMREAARFSGPAVVKIR